MTQRNHRLSILLVEDCPRRLKLVRDALERAKARCRLHGVGANREVLRYLRHQPPYSEAPKPDLVLLDYSHPTAANLDTLKELKSSEEFAHTPLAILTRPESETLLEEQFEATGTCAVFSPIELHEFLQTMRSQRTDRFVKAVSLLASLGIVLVRAPEEFTKREEQQTVSPAT